MREPDQRRMTDKELRAREAIRHTLASYNIAGDRLRAEDFAACFTLDGILESEFMPPGKTFRFEGRAAILEWQRRWRDADAGGSARRASFVRHHLTTCKIDLTGPDRATVRTYWVVWSDIGPDHAGHYLDSFRQVDGDWLIAHRRVREDWVSPGSLFGEAVAETRG
jgi:hypothetical protein